MGVLIVQQLRTSFPRSDIDVDIPPETRDEQVSVSLGWLIKGLKLGGARGCLIWGSGEIPRVSLVKLGGCVVVVWSFTVTSSLRFVLQSGSWVSGDCKVEGLYNFEIIHVREKRHLSHHRRSWRLWHWVKLIVIVTKTFVTGHFY